ncbi:hypothetical protein H5410_016532 [Solanum commersonii]|uniref:F-box/LRR-repeat protein 15/At3g58940/PEG3-like LRR domain-containing protein n=1 Tax=Solanum commersonii TaxID=4109 RepID=A0A9J5ZXN2_SOLCO|nr:hypothetical protein H5410_016532 [Solanum commersonii]
MLCCGLSIVIGFTLPESLCTCSSLITLDVQNCDLNKSVIAWNSLKSIKLGHLKLTDDDMVKLLSRCPALETVELYSYFGFRLLEINSLKLKTLKLKNYLMFAGNRDRLRNSFPVYSTFGNIKNRSQV